MFYTDNPAMDAENYYSFREREAEAWKAEAYIGDCPICGEPMYLGDVFSPVEKDMLIGDEYYEHVHRDCYWDEISALEEEEEDEDDLPSAMVG